MPSILLHIAAWLYLISTVLLVIFLGGFGLLLVIYARTRQKTPSLPDVRDDDLLSVTIQLPVYNEPHVVDRLLDACLKIDYPPEKLFIQLLDDSTDETTRIIQESIYSRQLCNVSHICRPNRDGYKAGALAYGLDQVNTDCVVIFDADFVPAPDFLRRTMPHFNANPNLGLIQTRWSHLNSEYNLLTRAQALSIDAHFGVEQVARSRGHLPMSMNGTGGLWRVDAIRDAGGWSAATLTEDLDLSYRAYMRGWQFLYLVDVAVPGELPPLVQAYKMQQARWATGSTQCLRTHLKTLLTCKNCSPLEKAMGLLHLSQYAVQPLILIVFLLTPLLLLGRMFHHLPNMTPVAIVGIIPPLVVAIAQYELYDDWRQRLLYFPVQFVATAAIVFNNSWAVLRALWPTSRTLEFKRTPKFRITGRAMQWAAQRYRIEVDATILGELSLSVYALFGLVIALKTLPTFAPYMLSYALSFALFAGCNLYQSWRWSRK